MEISEATPVPYAKWPLWTWFAYPALAIAIGGGLGYVVAIARQDRQPVHATADPVVAAPQPSSPSPEAARPSPEIEIDVPVKATSDGLAPRATPKPKGKPKPTKNTRCDVYDHMNGC